MCKLLKIGTHYLLKKNINLFVLHVQQNFHEKVNNMCNFFNKLMYGAKTYEGPYNQINIKFKSSSQNA